MRNLSDDDGEYDPVEGDGFTLNTSEVQQHQQTSRIQHDYVIVGKLWERQCIEKLLLS